jgi:hypothetical protein
MHESGGLLRRSNAGGAYVALFCTDCMTVPFDWADAANFEIPTNPMLA